MEPENGVLAPRRTPANGAMIELGADIQHDQLVQIAGLHDLIEGDVGLCVTAQAGNDATGKDEEVGAAEGVGRDEELDKRSARREGHVSWQVDLAADRALG